MAFDEMILYYVLPAAIALVIYLFFVKPLLQPKSKFAHHNVPMAIQKQLPGAAPQVRGGERGSSVQVRILWGSQTGTAEDFASGLVAEGRRRGLECVDQDIEDFDRDELRGDEVLVFMMATYGEGEPTDNARDFHDWLEQADSGDLARWKYTVFGLGNTTYEHYNAIGKLVDQRLEECGAERIYPLGLGDDDSSLEDDFVRWKEAGLWEAISGSLGVEMEGGNDAGVARRFEMTYVAAGADKPHWVGHERVAGSPDHRHPLLARVAVNRELHGPASERSCRHVEIALPHTVTYAAGDHLGIFPHNTAAEVQRLARAVGCVRDLDKWVELRPLDQPDAKPVLGPVSVRTAFTQLLDITAVPRKMSLLQLVPHCDDPEEAAALTKLGSKEDGDDADGYHHWVKEDRRTLADILEHFKSLNAPLDLVLEIVPSMVPRYYSISSSPTTAKGAVHVTAVVTRFTPKSGHEHEGVCTTHLLHTPVDALLPVYVRASRFRLPNHASTPLIMVGPGTGLAPFRGFLQRRRELLEAGKPLGPALLFFGCRHPDHDYIYRDELEAALADGVISGLHVAFSRAGPSKVYVQDLIREHAADVWALLGDGASVYVCGDATHMAPDVKHELRDVFVKQGNMSADDADAELATMVSKNRYQSDTWA